MFKLLALILMVTLGSAHAETLRPRVFVSIPPQKQLIERIAGNRLEVVIMLPPGESPETFSPTPKLIASLSNAVTYFQVGVPFERYWTNSIIAANKKIRIVECCDQFIKPGAESTDGHDMHIWTNPINVQLLAKLMLDELIQLDPANSAEYEKNYEELFIELSRLDMEIKNRLSRRETDYFISSHAAWTAFAEQYGLVQLALEKNGKEIGPRSLLEIIRLARRENLNTIFVMQQYRTPFIDNLARELDAKVINIDPLAEDYIANIYRVAGEIADSIRFE